MRKLFWLLAALLFLAPAANAEMGRSAPTADENPNFQNADDTTVIVEVATLNSTMYQAQLLEIVVADEFYKNAHYYYPIQNAYIQKPVLNRKYQKELADQKNYYLVANKERGPALPEYTAGLNNDQYQGSEGPNVPEDTVSINELSETATTNRTKIRVGWLPENNLGR
ncbi:hypothetical protein KC866_01735 [Patescibacteria group bacterium]|nr:hypothetical protein [Patescibacteria group bacterium]